MRRKRGRERERRARSVRRWKLVEWKEWRSCRPGGVRFNDVIVHIDLERKGWGEGRGGVIHIDHQNIRK